MDALHRWFEGSLGQAVIAAEHRLVSQRLASCRLRTVLQIGAFNGGQRVPLFGDARQWLFDAGAAGADVTGDCAAMPFASDSLDAVILAHQLEFHPLPHDVLREAWRVLDGEGWLVLIAFNPTSLWGVKRLAAGRRGQAPWSGRYYSRARIEDWMKVLGLSVEARYGLLLGTPAGQGAAPARFGVTEHPASAAARWFGGVQVILARKRVDQVIAPPVAIEPERVTVPGGLAQARSRHPLRNRSD